MNSVTKLAALNKFRGNSSLHPRQPAVTKVLVVHDLQVKSPDVFQVPLVINYGKLHYLHTPTRANFEPLDLPKQVEEYAHR